MKLKRSIILSLFNFITLSILPKDLFFDMGGVLLKVDKLKAFEKLGPRAFAHPTIKKRLFLFMDHIDEEKTGNEHESTHEGSKSPHLLCRWQKGQLTCEKFSQDIIDGAKNEQKFFNGNGEKKLIIKSGTFFLPPKNLSITIPIKEMLNTAKECKEAKDENGNYINRVFLTSNCNPEIFELTMQKFPVIAEIFDEEHRLISGDIHLMKPDVRYFKHALKKFNVDPKNCILIDDQKENINGAKKTGISGILHRNTAMTRKKLRKMGALPKFK